jgi:hypothetical protein
LAFATLFPDMQVYFMMILPIKIKWLAIIDGIYLAFSCLTYIGQYFQAVAGLPTELKIIAANYYLSPAIAIVLSVLNFIIFFFATRKNKYSPKEFKRRHEYTKQVKQAQGVAKHKCAICGRTSESNPELTFRFCSKCDGNYEYCEDHIFTHQHIKLQ